MRLALVIFFHLTFSTSFGQQPSYFKIGEEELTGVHIYDLLQDKNLNYWVATNNGVYKYDYYKFIKLDCEEMSSSSVFNLIENDRGDLFCNNLSGQIFEISDDKLELYYQIPDSLMYHEITIQFDAFEELTVLSNALFNVTPNKEVKTIFKPDSGTFSGGLIRDEYGELSFYSNLSRAVYKYGDGTISHFTNLSNQIQPMMVSLGSKHLLFDQGTGDLVSVNGKKPKTSKYEPKEGAIYYSDKKHVWQAFRTGGAKVYDKNMTPLFQQQEIFKDYFISALIQDEEGNILLGSFGDGIIVIPSLQTEDYQVPGSNERAVQIEHSPSGLTYIGCRSGKVYERNDFGTTTLISDKSTKTIEYIEFLKSENQIIFDGFPSKSTLAYSLTNHGLSDYDLLSLKDIKQIDEETYLIGNNMGCFWFYPKEKKMTRINSFNGRTNCVAYENNLIYSGASGGLKIGNEVAVNSFDLNGAPIICRRMLNIDGQVIISTQKNGILFFEEGALLKQWNTQTGLKSDNIFDVDQHMNDFIVSTDLGVYYITENGQTKFKFSTAVGFKASKPLDVEVYDNKLYVVYREAIKILDLNAFSFENYQPRIEMTAWSVNDQPSSLEYTNLDHSQNKVSFELASKSLKYRSETSYFYMLSSIDNEWQKRNFSDNIIEYKSLPSGSYTFQYYSEYEGQKSEKKSFSFIIKTPFWRSWWFFLSAVLVFILSVFIIYKRQLRRQQKIAQFKRESIESRLIAIQSQMNPHFIFNSLNSIQDLVLQQDGENAYNYISKFAFLVRKVLHYSEQDFIRLEDEVEMLKVYLELEQLRFDDDFEFSFDTSQDEVEIPPMIIQPYIENAIKHGLLHKEGLKKLNINIQSKKEVLIVEIIDNGIGRKKSKEINERKARNYKSFSTQSIQGRFEILKNIHVGKFGVEYEDQIDDKGKLTGTKVTIRLPINKNY